MKSDVGDAMLGVPPTPSPAEMRRFQRSLSNQLVGAGHPGVLSKFSHEPQSFEEARRDVQVGCPQLSISTLERCS